MKKRLISLIVIGTLSLSLMVACTKNNDTSNNTPSNTSSQTQEDNESPNSDKENNDESTNNSTVEDGSDTSIKNEDAIKIAFSEALTELYNTDYSVAENKSEAKSYARSKFSEEGFEEFLKNLNDYDSEFESSDLLITKIKEIQNDNTTYVKAYEVTYNVTITSGKPTAYSDLIGMVVEDKDGNILINSFNQRNF